MPSACAAATWPRGIDWMPARMISAKERRLEQREGDERRHEGADLDRRGERR